MDLYSAIAYCESASKGFKEEVGRSDYRHFSIFLQQLMDIKSGDLSSLTEEELSAVAKTIDKMIDSIRVRDYYFDTVKAGNDDIYWYNAVIIPKEGYSEHGFHDEVENRSLIPLPDGFVWLDEAIITNDDDVKYSEEQIEEIMIAHGFERCPNVC